ncbi:MAG: hypothetical protein M3Q73_01315 [bacterium]|nr:hypothetical protein [bacterium]
MYNDRLTWEVLEHHHRDPSTDWYWALGIITITFAGLCILLGNILLAIFVILGAVVGAMNIGRVPKLIRIELTPRGVMVENTLYPYLALESFWVEEHTHPAQIILQSKKHFMPYIIVPIGHMDPDDVRAYLLLHLKEVEHHESLAHKALEHFGF